MRLVGGEGFNIYGSVYIIWGLWKFTRRFMIIKDLNNFTMARKKE